MRHLEAEALRTVARAATGNRISDEEDLFDLVPNNKSHHFHLDSSFTSAYEQELRAILESPLSSLAPSPIASPLPGPSTCPRSNSDPQAYVSDLPDPDLFQIWSDEQEDLSLPPSPTLFPIDKTFHWSRNRWIHFHFNMAGQQQAPVQNQQLPIRGSGKAPSWGWKGSEDSITLPVFFDEVEWTCKSIGQQMDWQYIQAAILYADPTAADLWRRLSQANPANQATATWNAFKEECYGFYLKSNETRSYMPAHLEEAARILRASPISTLDEFGRFDRYIQNIGLDVTAGTSPLMSKHEYARMYISAIYPMLQMMIDQQLMVLFPNQNPVEEVRKAAKCMLESYRSPYVNPAPAFSPYTGVEQQASAPAPQYTQLPAVAPLPPYGQQQMMMPGGSILDMIEQLSKVTAVGPPLTYYNPYRFPLYSPQLQAAAPQAVQQQTIVQPADATVKTESSMEEWLLAVIQKLVDKGRANKRCRYDGCEIGYKECVSKKADMDKGLVKFNHIKQKLVMPDGSELPKGSGYLRPQVEKWHEERRSTSADEPRLPWQRQHPKLRESLGN